MTSMPQLLNFVAVASSSASGGETGTQGAAREALPGPAGGELAGQGEERIDFGALLRDLVLEGMIPEEFKHPFTLQVPGDEQQVVAEEGAGSSSASAGSESESVASPVVGEGMPLTGALAEMLQGALQQISQLPSGAVSGQQADAAPGAMGALAALTHAAGVKGQADSVVAEAVTSGQTALPAQLVAMLRNARSGAAPQASASSVVAETPSSPTSLSAGAPSVPPAHVSRETPAAANGVVVVNGEPQTSGQGEAASRQQSGAVSQSDLAQRVTTEPMVIAETSRNAQAMVKNSTTTGSLAAGIAETQTTQRDLSAGAPSATPTPASSLFGSQSAAQHNGQVPLDNAQPAPPASSATGATSSATASSAAGQTQAAAGVSASAPAAPPTPVVAAHATSPATPTTPPAAVELARQVSAKFGALRELGTGTHQLSIKVTPEEFGPIRVVARIEAGSVGIDLHTASATGRELLKAAMADIRRDLPPNLANATVNVADSGGGQGSNTQGGNANAGQQNTSQGGSSFDGRGGPRSGEGNSNPADRDQPDVTGAATENTRQVTGHGGGVDVLT